MEEAQQIQQEFCEESVKTLEFLPVIGHSVAAGYAIAGDFTKAEEVAVTATISTVVAGSVALMLINPPAATQGALVGAVLGTVEMLCCVGTVVGAVAAVSSVSSVSAASADATSDDI